MRKRYSDVFKSEVVLELLKEEKTGAQIASEPHVHPNQIYEWKAIVDEYPAVIRSQLVNGLEELGTWYRHDFSELVAARQPAHITRDEPERVAAWKLKRGVCRERNRILLAGPDRTK